MSFNRVIAAGGKMTMSAIDWLNSVLNDEMGSASESNDASAAPAAALEANVHGAMDVPDSVAPAPEGGLSSSNSSSSSRSSMASAVSSTALVAHELANASASAVKAEEAPSFAAEQQQLQQLAQKLHLEVRAWRQIKNEASQMRMAKLASTGGGHAASGAGIMTQLSTRFNDLLKELSQAFDGQIDSVIDLWNEQQKTLQADWQAIIYMVVAMNDPAGGAYSQDDEEKLERLADACIQLLDKQAALVNFLAAEIQHDEQSRADAVVKIGWKAFTASLVDCIRAQPLPEKDGKSAKAMMVEYYRTALRETEAAAVAERMGINREKVENIYADGRRKLGSRGGSTVFRDPSSRVSSGTLTPDERASPEVRQRANSFTR